VVERRNDTIDHGFNIGNLFGNRTERNVLCNFGRNDRNGEPASGYTDDLGRWSNDFLRRWFCNVNFILCDRQYLVEWRNDTVDHRFCFGNLFGDRIERNMLVNFCRNDCNGEPASGYADDLGRWSNDFLRRWFCDVNFILSDRQYVVERRNDTIDHCFRFGNVLGNRFQRNVLCNIISNNRNGEPASGNTDDLGRWSNDFLRRWFCNVNFILSDR
jgi:hypothetical protein